MKRLMRCLLVVSLGLFLGFPKQIRALDGLNEIEIANQAGQQLPEEYLPKGGTIVFEEETGQILFEREADTVWHSASLAKVMTLYLAYEARAQGRLASDQVFKVTQKHVDISQNPALSNNNMVLGAQYSFDELVQLAIVPSSNAATILLAETIAGGDESVFVDQMNAKAKELGMTQTHFYNVSGPNNELLGSYAPKGQPADGDSVISARDFAILVYHFLKDYPEFLQNTNHYFLTVKSGTEYEESFEAYHHSLPGGPAAYEGTDGIKTGSSDSADYNLVSTVKRGDTRLVMVILGVGTWPDKNAELGRNLISNALYDTLFSRYAYQKVLSQGRQTINGQEMDLLEDLYDVVDLTQKSMFQLTDGKLSLNHSRSYLLADQGAKEVAYKSVVPVPENATKQSEFLEMAQSLVSELGWLKIGMFGTGGLIFLVLIARLSTRARAKQRN